jgi:hypothetical protein
MGRTLDDYLAEAGDEKPEAKAKAPQRKMRRLDDYLAEGEYPAVTAAPEDTGGAMSAPFNVKDAIAETLNQPAAKPDLPGNTPRLAAPDDPARRQIALDSSIASGENADTEAKAAERHLNAAMAGSQDAVPFFPRIRAGVAAVGAGLQGQPMGPAYDAEFANARKQIDEAKAASPVYAAMGAAPVMLATPGGLAKTAGGRIAGGAAVGGLYGASAVDRPGVTAGELAEGAAIGAPVGALGALTGEAVSKYGVRGASPREDRAFMREMTITDGGEGSSAMLAKNKEGLARDYKKIIELRRDPEIRNAAQAPGDVGAQIMASKIKPLADAQGPRYATIDMALAQPGSAGPMTGKRLLAELDAAKKKGISAEAADMIDHVKDKLQNHVIPNTWGKTVDDVIPAQQFREWLSSVQSTAANTPGAINWTKPHAVANEVAKESKRIFNEYLDSAKLPGVAENIRRDNVPISVMSTMKAAMEAKAKKEQLQSMGLGQVMAQQNRSLGRVAAGAAAAHGNLPAAAAILAEPIAEKGVVKGLRYMNGLVDRMNLAAEQGATKAQMVRYAIENGMPQGMANVAADRLSKKVLKPEAKPAQKPGKHDFMVPMTMGEEQE